MTADEMTCLHALLERWHDEATSLLNTPGYENHSRGCLIKRNIREVMTALSIPGLNEYA